MQIVLGDWHKTGTVDLEAVEMLVRDSMHRAGAMTVQRLLCLPASAVARLSFGIAEGLLGFGLSASGHGLSTVT